MNDDETLVPLLEAPYAKEDFLQQLLEKHPDLLAGDQIDPEDPKRWLFITREMPVPGEDESGAHWSLDHLFLDQDGVPTFVETKRSSNPELRRTVVAQMLDYAANATAYWTIDLIRSRLSTAREREGGDVDELVAEFLGGEDEEEPSDVDPDKVETFWEQVGLNLRAGRIRMLFVADAIPPELRRVVEFLNKQMDPAEVLAVEVKQFKGEGLTALNSRVLGRTDKKPPPSRPVEWNEEKFWAAVDSAKLSKEKYDWLRWLYELTVDLKKEGKCVLRWGAGGKRGIFLLAPDDKRGFLRVISKGWIRVTWKRWNLPDETRASLKRELVSLVGAHIEAAAAPDILSGLIANRVDRSDLEKWIRHALECFARHAR